MTKDLREMNHLELRDLMDEIILEIQARAYAQGKADIEPTNVRSDFEAEFEKIKTVNRQVERDRIVEQAETDVEDLKDASPEYGEYKVVLYSCLSEFIVNKEKRTVVALLKGYMSGLVHARGIAKCAPDDCFNVHIGKAIALRRALGLEVPDEYMNAPQPTEVRVGDIVKVTLNNGEIERKPVSSLNGGKHNVSLPGRIVQYPSEYVAIIDDSREGVTQ